MKLRKIKGRKVHSYLTNLTRLKIRGRLFIKSIALLLIPFFLFSNLTFAQTFQIEKNTLARYSFMQFATAQDSAEFEIAVEKYMPLWLAKIERRMKESKDRITLPYVVLELTKQIENNAKEVNLPQNKIDEIIDILIEKAALKWEEVETGKEKIVDLRKRKYVAANLQNLKELLPKSVKPEEAIDILTLYAQKEEKNEADIIDVRLKLARLGVAQKMARSLLLTLQSGTIPADMPAIKKILFVDDNVESREEVAKFLIGSAEKEKAKLEIVEAGSLEEAKKALEESISSKSHFDLIITDGDLGNKGKRGTGIDVAIAARDFPAYVKTPIILQSGYSIAKVKKLYENNTGNQTPEDVITIAVRKDWHPTVFLGIIQKFGPLGEATKEESNLIPKTAISANKDETEGPEARERLTGKTKLTPEETLIWNDEHGVGIYLKGNMRNKNSEIVVHFFGDIGEKCFRVSSLEMDLASLFLATPQDMEWQMKKADETAAKASKRRAYTRKIIPILATRLSKLESVLKGDPNKIFVPKNLMIDFKDALNPRMEDILNIRRRMPRIIDAFLRLQKERDTGYYTLENSSRVERLVLGIFFKDQYNYNFFYTSAKTGYQKRMLEYLKRRTPFVHEKMRDVLDAEGRISNNAIDAVVKSHISHRCSRIVDNWIKWLNLPKKEALQQIEKWIRDAIPHVEVMLAREFPELGINPRLGESTPTPQTVIPNVEDLTKQVITHMFLRPEGPIDLSKIAIVMNKSLPNIFSNEKNAILKETLVQEYNKMIIDLNKHYCDGKGVVKVDPDKDDVPGVVNGLIDKGLKVIILGDKILTEKIPGYIKGKAAEDYCVVHLAADERNLDANSIYYLNLNAMVFIGTAILHNDEILFRTAYRLLVGAEPEEITITSFRARALGIINVLPRMIKFTGTIQDRKELQRLFSVSV